MNKISQTMLFRQAVVKYAAIHGVTKAAIKYNTNRQYVYRWQSRYDGTLQSLANQSRKPHRHPQQHTKDELLLIDHMRRRNPHDGLIVFWVKLRRRGYKRTVSSLYRILRKRNKLPVKLTNPKKREPKPYQQMTYPGERIQIDVKCVPSCCLVGEVAKEKFYQYTAIDEFTRCRYIEGFKEQSTYSSTEFLRHVLKAFHFKIECVQTDNGTEFTNRFTSKKETPSLFEKTLQELGIRSKLIRPYTPRHNGKVERSHRKDNEYFYASHSFYSFDDYQKQLQVHNRKYNNFPMRPLGWKSPKEYLHDFNSCV